MKKQERGPHTPHISHIFFYYIVSYFCLRSGIEEKILILGEETREGHDGRIKGGKGVNIDLVNKKSDFSLGTKIDLLAVMHVCHFFHEDICVDKRLGKALNAFRLLKRNWPREVKQRNFCHLGNGTRTQVSGSLLP